MQVVNHDHLWLSPAEVVEKRRNGVEEAKAIGFW
jgi:hypothetical protein